MRTLAAFGLAALLMLGSTSAWAQTINLDKTTKLIPQGWTVVDDDELKFKKNTAAVLNDEGQVVKGVLNSDTYLRPTGWKLLVNDYYYVETSADFFPPRFFRPFGHRYGVVIPAYGHVRYKSNTPVTFAADGTVLSGTIDNDVIVQLRPDAYGFVRFKDDTALRFYENGTVQDGTLAEDTRLRPLGWRNNLADDSAGFVEFKSGTTITFTEDGYVASGTPKSKVLWHNADGTSQELDAKVQVKFTENKAEAVHDTTEK